MIVKKRWRTLRGTLGKAPLPQTQQGPVSGIGDVSGIGRDAERPRRQEAWWGTSLSYDTRRRDADLQRLYGFHKGGCGPQRLALDLRTEGWRVSRRWAAKGLRALDLRAEVARKFKVITLSKHGLPKAPNRLEQDFTTAAPNRVGWRILPASEPTRAGYTSR